MLNQRVLSNSKNSGRKLYKVLGYSKLYNVVVTVEFNEMLIIIITYTTFSIPKLNIPSLCTMFPLIGNSIINVNNLKIYIYFNDLKIDKNKLLLHNRLPMHAKIRLFGQLYIYIIHNTHISSILSNSFTCASLTSCKTPEVNTHLKRIHTEALDLRIPPP